MRTDGTEFLQIVLNKIKARLDELEQSIEAGQKDIENMHEYYWQNYTEMDQYGYEDYDNQQALLRQVHDTEEKKHLRKRYVHMLDSPFFGRVDFCYDGEIEAEEFYIGIGNFAERAGDIPLIYDWRAPVSGLFYDYEKGKAFYEAPAGLITGEIVGKGQYKIRDGKMLYSFESDIKIDDEILKEELGKEGDVKLKNIVRTIQKEQNAIIRNRRDKIMVIQGTAGSGKTSVALHRIAYLLYHERNNLKSSDILILTPNGIFADYISHILPELGEENIREMSFDLFAYKELKDIVSDCEDRYDQIERQISGLDEENMIRYRMKQSEEYIGIVEAFLARMEDELISFTDIEWRGYRKSEEELIRLFYDRFQNIPLLSRMDAIMDYCVDEYETLSEHLLSDEEIEKIREKFMKMYETTDVYQIYNQLLEENQWPQIPDVPYEKRILKYEDVYPVLYLKYRLYGPTKQRNMKHLVIDEMQDYSYLQYVILRMLFSCRMTILGDRTQMIEEQKMDIFRLMPRIFGKDLKRIEMNRSYRNTFEIASYAAGLAGIHHVDLFERHGKDVSVVYIDRVDEAVSKIVELLNGKNDYETAAIIVMTEKESEYIYGKLEVMGVSVSYLDRNSERFPKGLVVTTFYLAKGLEFDRVFGIFPQKDRCLKRSAEYISATRALHELYMFYVKENIIEI